MIFNRYPKVTWMGAGTAQDRMPGVHVDMETVIERRMTECRMTEGRKTERRMTAFGHSSFGLGFGYIYNVQVKKNAKMFIHWSHAY
jgi:hypothetical protein